MYSIGVADVTPAPRIKSLLGKQLLFFQETVDNDDNGVVTGPVLVIIQVNNQGRCQLAHKHFFDWRWMHVSSDAFHKSGKATNHFLWTGILFAIGYCCKKNK